jgi:adenosylmethionine-8-amino-7-oxononanoate aminotransferase
MDHEKESAQMNSDSDDQALRLLRAFYNVDDREVREIIITLAESAERGDTLSATAIGGSALSQRETA